MLVEGGKVGIGTSSPAGKLDVDSSFYTGTGQIYVDPQDGSNEGGEVIEQQILWHTSTCEEPGNSTKERS